MEFHIVTALLSAPLEELGLAELERLGRAVV
jgi:hypothetical protein